MIMAMAYVTHCISVIVISPENFENGYWKKKKKILSKNLVVYVVLHNKHSVP